MKKKKTYIFNEDTLRNLEGIQQITRQTETQIISDALKIYEEYLKKETNIMTKLDLVLEKIEKLSLELGACKERLRDCEEKLLECEKRKNK